MGRSGSGGGVQKFGREVSGVNKNISKAQLAREMLEEAVSEWQEAPEGRESVDFLISDVDGEINILLEFKTSHGPTTILFNPQATVEELVEACQRRLERLGLWGNERLRERLLRTQINGSIKIMLAVIRSHFEDSLWELPLVVSTLYDWKITSPDSRRRLFDDLLESISERRRERFAVEGRGRRKKIVDEAVVYIAIKNLKRKPSQKALAKELGVSTRTLRTWLKDEGFESLGDFIKGKKTGKKGRK
jgi:hypothetical protein